MTMARALQPWRLLKHARTRPLCSRCGDVTLRYMFNCMRYQDNEASDTLLQSRLESEEHVTSSDDLSMVPSTVKDSVGGLGWRRFHRDLWWLETVRCEGADVTSVAADTASQRGVLRSLHPPTH